MGERLPLEALDDMLGDDMDAVGEFDQRLGEGVHNRHDGTIAFKDGEAQLGEVSREEGPERGGRQLGPGLEAVLHEDVAGHLEGLDDGGRRLDTAVLGTGEDGHRLDGRQTDRLPGQLADNFAVLRQGRIHRQMGGRSPRDARRHVHVVGTVGEAVVAETEPRGKGIRERLAGGYCRRGS